MTVGTADLQLDSLITVILASGPGIPLWCLGSTKKWLRFFEYWLCAGGGAWRDSPVVSSPLPAASLSLASRAWGEGWEPESAFPPGPPLLHVFGWISFLLLRRQIAGSSWGFRYERLAWS